MHEGFLCVSIHLSAETGLTIFESGVEIGDTLVSIHLSAETGLTTNQSGEPRLELVSIHLSAETGLTAAAAYGFPIATSFNPPFGGDWFNTVNGWTLTKQDGFQSTFRRRLV